MRYGARNVDIACSIRKEQRGKLLQRKTWAMHWAVTLTWTIGWCSSRPVDTWTWLVRRITNAGGDEFEEDKMFMSQRRCSGLRKSQVRREHVKIWPLG